MDLEELIAMAESIQADLAALLAKAEALLQAMTPAPEETPPTPEEVVAAEASYSAVEKKIKAAKAKMARIATLIQAKRDLKIEVKTLPKESAKAVDHGSDEQAKEEGFFKHIRGEEITGQMRAALKPKSTSWKNITENAVVLPSRLAAKIMGSKFAAVHGKAVPMTAADQIAGAIPEDFRATMLQMPGEAPHIMDLANVQAAPYGSVTWPRLAGQVDSNEYGGVSFSWIDEGAEKPEMEITIEQLTIATHELAGYTEVTKRALSRSAIQLEAYLTALFRDAALAELDRVFLVGTGVGQPLGIVSQDPVTGEQIRIVARNAAGTVSWTDLVNLEFVLRAYHRANCRYIYQDTVGRSLKLQVDTTNRPLFTASMGNGILDRLNGYPHMGTHRLPALGARGDIVIGDWRQYIIAMEEEVVIDTSEHYKFRNNLIAFRICVVAGGHWAHARAFALLDNVAATTTGGWASSTTPTATSTTG